MDSIPLSIYMWDPKILLSLSARPPTTTARGVPAPRKRDVPGYLILIVRGLGRAFLCLFESLLSVTCHIYESRLMNLSKPPRHDGAPKRLKNRLLRSGTGQGMALQMDLDALSWDALLTQKEDLQERLARFQQAFSQKHGRGASSRPGPVWPARAIQTADRPRLAGDWGGLGHGLALKEASRAPADRGSATLFPT